MKIGVCIPNHRVIMPIEDVMDAAERAEVHGFDSVWVNDHVVIPDEAIAIGFTRAYFDAFMVLANAAARTKRVQLGASVIVLPYRNPLVQAKMLVTLDHLSNGRVILGAGVGGLADEFRALGVPMKERGARTDETLAIFQEVWHNERPEFHGRFNTISNVYFLPPPVQQPGIPIWIGGASPQAFRRTAQYADAWHPNVRSFRRIRESLPILQEEWKRFGREGEPKVTQRMRCTILGEAQEGRRPIGTGSLEQVIGDLDEAREIGIEHMVVDFNREQVIDAGEWNQQFERFAAEVLPRYTSAG